MSGALTFGCSRSAGRRSRRGRRRSARRLRPDPAAAPHPAGRRCGAAGPGVRGLVRCRTTDTALGQIADLTGTRLRWDLPLAGMEGSTPIRVRENGCPPGQIVPNAGKQTYSTLCCAPSTPAATNSTSPTGSCSPSATLTAHAPTPSTSSVSWSPTGSCSPSATPTAHAPTPSTSSVSCATTTAQTGVRATAPDLRRAPMRRTFLSRLRALRMDGQRSAPNTTSGRVPHGIVLAADGAAAPGTKGPSVL
jgi:hypothetical protein